MKKKKEGFMSDEDFAALREGAIEMVSIVKGHKKPDSKNVIKYDVPDAKLIRESIGLSQAEFSKKFGLNIRTLQDWECNRRNPVGPAAILLKVIEKSPETVASVV